MQFCILVRKLLLASGTGPQHSKTLLKALHSRCRTPPTTGIVTNSPDTVTVAPRPPKSDGPVEADARTAEGNQLPSHLPPMTQPTLATMVAASHQQTTHKPALLANLITSPALHVTATTHQLARPRAPLTSPLMVQASA